MTRSRRTCVDCGEPLDPPALNWGYVYCAACRENYTRCARCGESTHLRDMRQAYCVDCRRAYDQDRWAKQRAARS